MRARLAARPGQLSSRHLLFTGLDPSRFKKDLVNFFASYRVAAVLTKP